jgi:hypothetical protein
MKKGPAYRMMIYLSKRMIACDEASYLISLREDRRLGFIRWAQLNMHLLTCRLCRKYASQIRQLSHSLAMHRLHCNQENCMHHLSPEAGSRILEELTRELNAN